MGIRPGPNGPNVANASAAAPAANDGRPPNAPPIETTHLMCEKVQPHRLSRNGTVNNEVSHALDLMDCGADVKKIWRRLDDYVTVDSQEELDKTENEANKIANRMKEAQLRLAEAVYKREWSDECPILPPPARHPEWRTVRMSI